MGPYPDDFLHAAWGLPMPKAGKFYPDQPGSEDWPKVPGYSCARCGCLVARRLTGWFHLWNRSMFCRPLYGDFHLARPYQGE